MTPEEAWRIVRDNIKDDCGPDDEGWPSSELMDAEETLDEIHAPDLTRKAMFPDKPFMWAPKDQPKP